MENHSGQNSITGTDTFDPALHKELWATWLQDTTPALCVTAEDQKSAWVQEAEHIWSGISMPNTKTQFLESCWTLCKAQCYTVLIYQFTHLLGDFCCVLHCKTGMLSKSISPHIKCEKYQPSQRNASVNIWTVFQLQGQYFFFLFSFHGTLCRKREIWYSVNIKFQTATLDLLHKRYTIYT